MVGVGVAGNDFDTAPTSGAMSVCVIFHVPTIQVGSRLSFGFSLWRQQRVVVPMWCTHRNLDVEILGQITAQEMNISTCMEGNVLCARIALSVRQ